MEDNITNLTPAEKTKLHLINKIITDNFKDLQERIQQELTPLPVLKNSHLIRPWEFNDLF